MQAAELNKAFGIADSLRFEDGAGGLTRAVISTAAAEADLYLQGAHVAHWTPSGQRPVLYVSPQSLFVPGKAIRGGVPLIFPWFGPRHDGKPGGPHGFARTMDWAIESTKLHGDSVEIALTLDPPDFHLRFRVVIGATLEMELEVRNESRESVTYEEALHTYLAIGDIHQVSVSGLEGTTYIDKTDASDRKPQGDEAVRFTKETDRVYVSTQSSCVVHDPVWNRRILVEKTGSDSTVVWNPWIEKTKTMADMAADGWKDMVCVETANVAENAVPLAAGESHRLTTTIRVA
ncbi:MAG: D-hexose-6-phosphate mutarotase [Acidobacteriota bacterium]